MGRAWRGPSGRVVAAAMVLGAVLGLCGASAYTAVGCCKYGCDAGNSNSIPVPIPLPDASVRGVGVPTARVGVVWSIQNVTGRTHSGCASDGWIAWCPTTTGMLGVSRTGIFHVAHIDAPEGRIPLATYAAQLFLMNVSALVEVDLSGRLLWKEDIIHPATDQLFDLTSVAGVQVVLATFQDGRVMAISEDGIPFATETLEETEGGGVAGVPLQPIATPAVAGSRAYVLTQRLANGSRTQVRAPPSCVVAAVGLHNGMADKISTKWTTPVYCAGQRGGPELRAGARVEGITVPPTIASASTVVVVSAVTTEAGGLGPGLIALNDTGTAAAHLWRLSTAPLQPRTVTMTPTALWVSFANSSLLWAVDASTGQVASIVDVAKLLSGATGATTITSQVLASPSTGSTGALVFAVATGASTEVVAITAGADAGADAGGSNTSTLLWRVPLPGAWGQKPYTGQFALVNATMAVEGAPQRASESPRVPLARMGGYAGAAGSDPDLKEAAPWRAPALSARGEGARVGTVPPPGPPRPALVIVSSPGVLAIAATPSL